MSEVDKYNLIVAFLKEVVFDFRRVMAQTSNQGAPIKIIVPERLSEVLVEAYSAVMAKDYDLKLTTRIYIEGAWIETSKQEDHVSIRLADGVSSFGGSCEVPRLIRELMDDRRTVTR